MLEPTANNAVGSNSIFLYFAFPNHSVNLYVNRFAGAFRYKPRCKTDFQLSAAPMIAGTAG